ncbi:MAG: hypothetical protein KatS3mg111_0494 [Pirellulaceae bacterium]|nr:MAG: hypothetical protein KatS3mg111_0494 [Pirellulaceae bacterium]
MASHPIPARLNPFAVDRVTALPFRLTAGDWPALMTRLQELNYRGAIVGPQGSGKTTVLEQLEREIPTHLGHPAWYVRMPHQPSQRAAVVDAVLARAGRTIVLLDSAEKTPWRGWVKIVQKTRPGGLLVAVHRRCGLPVWLRTTTTPELLASLVRELGYTSNELPQDAIEAIFRQHRGNLRDALRFLYDQVARGNLPLPRPVL